MLRDGCSPPNKSLAHIHVCTLYIISDFLSHRNQKKRKGKSFQATNNRHITRGLVPVIRSMIFCRTIQAEHPQNVKWKVSIKQGLVWYQQKFVAEKKEEKCKWYHGK
jgi:hypothetical protein